MWCDLVNLSSALTTSVSMTLKKRKKKKSLPQKKSTISIYYFYSVVSVAETVWQDCLTKLSEDTIGTETAVLEINTHFVTFILGEGMGKQRIAREVLGPGFPTPGTMNFGIWTLGTAGNSFNLCQKCRTISNLQDRQIWILLSLMSQTISWEVMTGKSWVAEQLCCSCYRWANRKGRDGASGCWQVTLISLLRQDKQQHFGIAGVPCR